uniref:Minor structural protein n=1 Tax=Siphoviridae sp. ctqSm5 TaxID=2827949 RepID=A0A8S5SQ70_9CAUD|nr:MAG TPA: minor structural protein [Siphoviridae sp. ctqSm5]
MHRQINLNKKNSYYIELHKNRREVLAEIPKEFITNIEYSSSTYPTMTIEIPDKIHRGGKDHEVLLYNQIKGKMFIIIDINGVKERFIIDEDIEIEETKDGKLKKLTAYGYEKTTEKKTLLISNGATRQLYRPKNEQVEVSDGILNWFEEQTGWKVNHVEELARKELGLYYVTKDELLFENFEKEVKKNEIIWEKDVVIDVPDKAINMTISYPNMRTIDSNGNVLKTETIAHTFSNLPYNVRKIQAVYTSDTDYLFGITYTITYENNTTQTHKFSFANVTDLKMEAPSISLNYETNELKEHYTTKYRFFEQCSTKWYNFLQSEVSEAFDCVFEFDNYNMELNVYAKENYGTNNGLYLDWTHIEKINKTFKTGDVVSRLYIESPNTSIVEENPLGTEYVECFDYYINSGIMSQSLIDALKNYDVLLEQKQVEFLTIKLEKNKVDQLLTKKNSEHLALNERYKAENAILTGYIKAGNQSNLQAQQSEVVEKLDLEIQAIMLEIQELKDKSNEYLEKMTNIGVEIKKENAMLNGNKVFTEEDILELDDYIIEGATTNDYYTVALSLYNHAVEVIKDMNSVYIDFTMSTYDFMKKIAHPQGWQKFIRLGEKIEINDKDVADNEGFVQLHGYSISPRDDSMSGLKFTNNKEPISDIKTISDIGRQSNATTHMTDFYKEVWKDAANNNVHVADIIQNGLDVAAQVVRGKGTVNRVDISESGIYIIDAQDENKQLYLGSGLISFTLDRWRTSKLAIDTNGVIADSLIGKVILGQQLYIGNENNTVVINPNGMSIYDPLAVQEERIFLGIENNKAVLRLHSADGNNKLVLSEQGIYQVFPVQARDSFDRYNSFKVPFYLPTSLQRLDEARLILNLEKFRAYSKAMSTQPESTDTKTSLSGGATTVNTTSASGGATTVNTTSNNGGGGSTTPTSSQSGATHSPSGTAIDPTGQGNPSIQNHVHQTDTRHTHTVTVNYPAHSHTLSVNIPNHTHTLNVNIPNHTHDLNVNIPNHTHDISVTIPSHSHNIEYGIYEFPTLPTVRILLDGVVIDDNVTTNQSIDLSNKFTYLGGTHNLEIVSLTKTGNVDGLGRASLDLFVSGFVSY